ncbi:MAG: type II toxin-antitoxin system VapB family antitoxin [Methylobacter sp.]|nr:type II toxin-antitoxin system VapB family antitoxin [Methylobacter sp.]
MKATISLDNAVLEQLLAYTKAKTAKESIAKAIEEYIRYQQRQELLNCRGSVEIDDNWQQLRELERPQ